MTSKEAFSGSARWYDLLYAEKDYEALPKLIAELLPPGEHGTLIEYGAGTGRYLTEFHKLGYNVQGVEPSPSMRKIALAKGLEVHPGDLYHPHDDHEVSCALFGVMSYAATTADQFDMAISTLKDSGQAFVFDFVNATAACRDFRPAEQRWVDDPATGERLYRDIAKNFNPDTGMIVYDMHFRLFNADEIGLDAKESWRETHYMRAFSPAEIAFALQRHGVSFALCNAEKPYTDTGSLSPVGDGWYGLAIAGPQLAG
jgi:SAM-dependent methyltransferase